MKVDHTEVNRLAQKQAENAGAVEKTQPARANEIHKDSLNVRDRASLSEQARLLAKARTALEDTSEVRTDLVNELRSKVKANQYEVPVEQLAQRLVSRFKLE